MRRISRMMTFAAVICMGLGLATFPITLLAAIPALVVGTAAVLCALFAWFRWNHLWELDRLGR
jgi:hypothetical protein